jgi:hypothetical protein
VDYVDEQIRLESQLITKEATGATRELRNIYIYTYPNKLFTVIFFLVRYPCLVPVDCTGRAEDLMIHELR